MSNVQLITVEFMQQNNKPSATDVSLWMSPK